MRINKILSILFFLSVFSLGETSITISDSLEIYRLRENLYVHRSYEDLGASHHIPANGLIIVNDGEAVIIDTPWNDGESTELINYPETQMGLDIRAIVLTHWYQDCMGEIVIPGHGNPGGIELIEHTISLLENKR